ALIYYGFELYLVGRYSEAEPYQKAVVKVAPSDLSFGLLSQTYYAENKFKDAEAAALQGLSKNPSEETCLNVIAGNLYWNRSNSGMVWKDVIAKLSSASSKAYWVKVGQANSLMQQNKDKEATELLNDAKQDTFPDPAAFVSLGYIFQRADAIGSARDIV